MNAFERDTLYRLLTEAARYWVVSRFLETKQLPAGEATFYTYSHSMNWGDGVDSPPDFRPLRGKRIKITIEVEDQAR